MKELDVLIITSSGYPDSTGDYAGSIFVERIVDELKKHVSSITVIAPRPYVPRMFRGLSYAQKKGLAVHSYKKDNIAVYYPRYVRIRKAYPFARMTKAVKRVIEKNNISPDLVHAHYLLPSGPIGKHIVKELSVPLIITGHGQDVYAVPYSSKMHHRMAKEALQAADYVSTVSEDNAEHIKHISGVTPEMIYNGYDASVFFWGNTIDARKQLEIPEDASIIVQAGRIEENKNQLATLRACRELQDKGIDIHCYLVGQHTSASYVKELETYITSHSLTEKIHIIGPVSQKELGEYFRAADLSVIPSYKEGNPTVLIESLACGTPVVGSDISGIRDMLDGSVTGALFELGDDEGYAEAILQWKKKSEKQPSVISGGVISYSTKAIAQQWKAIYESLLK